MDWKKLLGSSLTSYHTVENAAEMLKSCGFSEWKEYEGAEFHVGGKYFTVRDGSALIAFSVGSGHYGYRIVASHTDSPCFKLKANPERRDKHYVTLNAESYGGGIYYSFLDRPLKIAGRIVAEQGGVIRTRVVESAETVVIPSVAIHFNREVNQGIALKVQTDLQPLAGSDQELNVAARIASAYFEGEYRLLDYDLYVCSAQEPFLCGFGGEYLCAPGIDNRTSVFASVGALCGLRKHSGIAMCYLADNEEVGSATKQGAGSLFLADTIRRINRALGYSADQLDCALAESFLVSADNAHAAHPNHAELSDPTNRVYPNEGIVVKHHANQNYTTDAVSSAIFRSICERAGVPVQDFYMNSNLRCGGTLGAISSGRLSVRSVDIGLAQLAMHSAVEMLGVKDLEYMERGLRAFYESDIHESAQGIRITSSSEGK